MTRQLVSVVLSVYRFTSRIPAPRYQQIQYRQLIARFPRFVKPRERVNREATAVFKLTATARFVEHSSPIFSCRPPPLSRSCPPFFLGSTGEGITSMILRQLRSRAACTHVEKRQRHNHIVRVCGCFRAPGVPHWELLVQPCRCRPDQGKHARAW